MIEKCPTCGRPAAVPLKHGLVPDLDERRLWWGDDSILMRPIELAFVITLCRAYPRHATHRDLERGLWGIAAPPTATLLICKYASNVRKRLARAGWPHKIKNFHFDGFALEIKDSAARGAALDGAQPSCTPAAEGCAL